MSSASSIPGFGSNSIVRQPTKRQDAQGMQIVKTISTTDVRAILAVKDHIKVTTANRTYESAINTITANSGQEYYDSAVKELMQAAILGSIPAAEYLATTRPPFSKADNELNIYWKIVAGTISEIATGKAISSKNLGATVEAKWIYAMNQKFPDYKFTISEIRDYRLQHQNAILTCALPEGFMVSERH